MCQLGRQHFHLEEYCKAKFLLLSRLLSYSAPDAGVRCGPQLPNARRAAWLFASSNPVCSIVGRGQENLLEKPPAQHWTLYIYMYIYIYICRLEAKGGAKASAPEWESGGQRGRKKHALFLEAVKETSRWHRKDPPAERTVGSAKREEGGREGGRGGRERKTRRGRGEAEGRTPCTSSAGQTIPGEESYVALCPDPPEREEREERRKDERQKRGERERERGERREEREMRER